MPGKRIYLSLGSNIGAREEHLDAALAALERERVHVIARSSIYETEPQDVIQQPWFLNMVVECETSRFPLQLLALLLNVERQLGRVRKTGLPRRGPRVIDLDILLFGNVVMDVPQLTIPHPRMLERRFVLEPLLEIAPELRHPATKEPLVSYLGKVKGQKLRLMRPPSR
jgi:2-amino-4-hydroxy-6-hydroxymethyldihydropteridine diphosphokinase